MENDTTGQNDAKDLKKRLLNDGEIFYTGQKVSADNIKEEVENWLKNKKNQQVQTYNVEDINVIQYKASKGFIRSLGWVHAFDLYFVQQEGKLYYNIYKSKWCENPQEYKIVDEFEQGNLVSNSYQKEIEKVISGFLFGKLMPDSGIPKVAAESRYRESLNNKQLIALLSMLNDEEILLINLGISSFKEYPVEVKQDDLKLKWTFTTTSNRVMLIAWDKRNTKTHCFDLSKKDLKVKSGLGRNTVECHYFIWLTNFGNAAAFKEIEHIESFAAIDRIREVARLLKIKNESTETVFRLLDMLSTKTDNPFDELTLLFVELAEDSPKDIISKNTEDERLKEALQKIAQYDKTTDKLVRWSNEWNISYIDSIALVKLLQQIATSTIEYKRILPFHKLVRGNFHQQNKDKIAHTIFEVEFCRHLIKAEEKKEAEGILNQLLSDLPDESILEILPPQITEEEDRQGGQFLKLQVIDLLLAAKQEGDLQKLLYDAALLQPLSPERIEKLINVTTGSLQHRAEKILSLLNNDELNTDRYDSRYKLMGDKLADSKIEMIKHPETRNGGIFAWLQNWLAEVEIPEEKEIRKYADKLSREKFAEIYEETEKLSRIFQIEKPEIFVSRGENKTGVTAYEGEHPFCVIGAEHITEGSCCFLRPPEWRFILAAEMSHLYFHHSRITSNDLWRGATEKGYAAIDTLLKVVPGLGLVGSSLRRIAYLNRAIAWLKQAEKVVHIAGNTKEVVKTASQIIALYSADKSPADKTNEKQNELLATTRVMQLTADRAGLVISGEPKAALRAIFHTSEYYNQHWQEVKDKGLIDVLSTKSENGSLRFADLSIRITALFAFYLSDEYIKLRKEVVEL